MNKLLLYSLFLFFLAQATEITRREGLFVSQRFDSMKLIKNNEGFVHPNNEHFNVHDYHVVLHNPNCDNIENFEKYDQIQMSQLSNDEHTLMDNIHLNGRNHVRETAWFWISKFAVHAVAQTAFALVAGATSLIHPAVAPVVYCSLQLTFAAPVEIVSNMIAYGRMIPRGGAISHV